MSGYYWNQSNFEGLTSLAAALRADSRLEHLAAYCELREKGLRRESFAQLDAFLNEAASWDAPVQRLLAVRVLETHWNAPQVHQFFADPLRKRFVERVLEEWRAADANDPIPARYLALLCGDRALLDEALRLNPKDDDVRAAIAGLLLSFVDHATHHVAALERDLRGLVGQHASLARVVGILSHHRGQLFHACLLYTSPSPRD